LGCPLFASIIDGRQRTDQVFLQHKEGYRIPVQINILPIIEDGSIIGAVEIFRQGSFEVHESSIIHKPLEVPLNGKFTTKTNCEKTESYITYKLHELKLFQRKFCVIFLGIDNFGKLKDTHGPDAGKKLFDGVYKSISYNIRPYDFFSYLNYEEFIGVFEIKKKYEATLLAEKISILVAGSDVPHELGNLSATASLGATVARENDTTSTIIQRADTLMRQSKQKGKNSVSSDA
jgi:diguanylate cyclase (GGDEF)-like protein